MNFSNISSFLHALEQFQLSNFRTRQLSGLLSLVSLAFLVSNILNHDSQWAENYLTGHFKFQVLLQSSRFLFGF